MTKTIALYISSLTKGGAERVIANLAGYFFRERYRVVLVTTRKAQEEYQIPEGIIRRISEPEEKELEGGRTRNFVRRYQKLRAIWKEEKPDVILSFIGKNNMMAILTSAGLGIPVAVSVRGMPREEYYSRGMRLMARWLFGFAGGVILQTKECFSFFPKRVQKKAVILKNPVNQVFFRERFQGVRDKTIVAVGRIDENKNQKLLVDAFIQTGDEFPEYKLIIYGEGEMRRKLQEYIRGMGLEERILLPGNVEQVADVIYKARVFVLSSNTEGMPNTLIEAMLLGLTVISTDCPCGGPADLIVHGVNGLLTPVGDVEKMKESLQMALRDEKWADKMGKEAAKIKEAFAEESVYGSWKNYLESLIKKS